MTDIGTDQQADRVEIPVDGRRVRLAAVDVAGALVVVMVQAEYEDVAQDADALIASMAFE